MRLRDCDTASILNLLRNFSYEKVENGETVTVNVELYPAALNPVVNIAFLQRKGNLKCDLLMEHYKKEALTAQNIADLIKQISIQKWKHLIEIWNVDYNPIWNVDGVETRTIKTEYGKTEETTYDSKLVDDQTADGKNNTTHGRKVDYTEPTDTQKAMAYDAADFVNATQNTRSDHYDEESGTTNTAISSGTVEHEHSGSDTLENSGEDNVTDILERHGNIGVTMTQQLLVAEKDFWEKFNFFEAWFNTIAEEMTIPIYE